MQKWKCFDLIINQRAYQKTIPKKLKNKTTVLKNSIQINFAGKKTQQGHRHNQA